MSWLKQQQARLLLAGLMVLLVGCGSGDLGKRDKAVKDAWADIEYRYEYRSDKLLELIKVIDAFDPGVYSEARQVLNDRVAVENIQVNFRGEMLTNPQTMQRYLQAQETLGQSFSALQIALQDAEELHKQTRYQTLHVKLMNNERRLAIAYETFEEAASAYNHSLETDFWKDILYRELQPVSCEWCATDQTVDQ